MGKSTRRGDFRVDPYENFPLMGQLTCANTGTVYQFPSPSSGVRLTLAPHPLNSGTVWLGNLAASTPLDSYPLTTWGAPLCLEGIADMAMLYAIAEQPGDRICWVLQVGCTSA
jgi:hypothetical protein